MEIIKCAAEGFAIIMVLVIAVIFMLGFFEALLRMYGHIKRWRIQRQKRNRYI